MFGLNLWPRPFIHPAAAAAAGAPGLDQLSSSLPRPPVSLPTPPYLLPGLPADKLASLHGLTPNSFLFYRPGDHLVHPAMLRLDPASNPPATVPERTHLSVSAGENDEGSYLSAFVPTKRLRPDPDREDRHSSDARSVGTPGTEGRSPSAGPRSGTGSPRRIHSPASSDVHEDRMARLDANRQRAYSPIDATNPRCPLCSQKLQPGEIRQHYVMEMERIVQMQCYSKTERDTPDRSPRSPIERQFAAQHPQHGTISNSRYETFLKIKNNRHARLNAKFKCRRKRPSDPLMSPTLSEHSRRESEGESNHPHAMEHLLRPINSDALNKQENVHVTVSSAHYDISLTRQVPAINTEATPCTSASSPSIRNNTVASTAGSQEDDKELEIDVTTPDPPTSGSSSVADIPAVTIHPGIRENNNGPNGLKMNNMTCHVCRNTYDKPVTSVHCWHVHCEQCWLKALGSRPSCPQCNIATTPSDLRKVFI